LHTDGHTTRRERSITKMSEPDVLLLKRMYDLAFTIRRFELAAVEQYRLGNIRGYLHPYLGEEAIAVGAIVALETDDYIVSTHRGHGHALAKGHDASLMMAELFGKETGYCRGRGGSMHVANLAQANLGANGIVGGGLPIAVGAAMGLRLKGASNVVLSFFGDGAAGNGVFHESLNLAAVYALPVVFVLENNHYAVSTPVEFSSPVVDLSLRAAGYAMPGVTVDGNDAVCVYEATVKAVARARSGGGPSLIECKTYRHGGHHVNDPGQYMPRETLDHWKARDPVLLLKKRLLATGISASEIEALESDVEERIEASIRFALASPEPSVEDFIAAIDGE
jgi:TPP-dependent pyruvate/acetoin dehydrogenase alpha subunit